MSEYQPEEKDLVTINMQALCSFDITKLQEIIDFNVDNTGDEVNREALERLVSFEEG